MLDAIARTIEYDRRQTLELARSIPDSVCDRLPAGLKQSPAWIVCHLCLADTLQRAGLTHSQRDQEFFEQFGPDSDIPNARGPMTERFGTSTGAIDAAARSHAALVETIRNADPEELAKPHPNEQVRVYFPTLADNVAYIAWHEGNHGGQLRAWMHAARHDKLV